MMRFAGTELINKSMTSKNESIEFPDVFTAEIIHGENLLKRQKMAAITDDELSLNLRGATDIGLETVTQVTTPTERDLPTDDDQTIQLTKGWFIPQDNNTKKATMSTVNYFEKHKL